MDSMVGDSGLAILCSLLALVLLVRYGPRDLALSPRIIDAEFEPAAPVSTQTSQAV